SLAPVALGLHPHAGALLIKHAIVLVLLEIALALHQAEAPRSLIGETIDPHGCWIGQWSPDPLATSGPELQPVGVVNLGAPVLRKAVIVLAAEEHTGAGSDAEPLDLLARIQGGIDVHQQGVGNIDDEAIGPGNTRRIQQAVEDQSA